MNKISNAVSAAASLFFTAVIAGGQSTSPDVTLRYTPLFDTACGDATKRPVEPEAATELRSRMESIRALWSKEGPQLLGAVPSVTGIPFRFHEASATLILCSGFPNGMSAPLLINMRIYLTATSKGSPVAMIDFTNALFHELLHRYVGDCLGMPSRITPIMAKYKTEPQSVPNHLHLYAIEGLVYRKLGREKDLAVSIAAEQTLKEAPTLKRAREIVATEGAENLIRELKNAVQ
jgi:hypothetical protein